ncbi:MAG TPA: hypothetical protein VLY65_02200, partial [Nitrososphaerales archaeon]|nr:hypothetical protein [Nitrososphaerales archaeon]
MDRRVGLGFRPVLVLFAATILFGLGCSALPAHAADDSNSGQLAQVPTVSPQQLSSAFGALSQGSNDTQLQQLLTLFQSQLNSGNYTGASSTLVQLQGLSGSQAGGSQALNALIQSLSLGNGGASVNAKTLEGLLNANPGSGSGQPGQRLSLDMQTLANLMQYANATMASELLQNSSALSMGALQGGSLPTGGAPSVALPGMSGLSVPPISAPSLGVRAPSGGLPAVSLSALTLPLVAVFAMAGLYLSRGRIAKLAASRSLPGVSLFGGARPGDGGDAVEAPADPRSRIEFYFRKATRIMAGRGVPKLESETHREFSSKCELSPERAHVSTISS